MHYNKLLVEASDIKYGDKIIGVMKNLKGLMQESEINNLMD